MVRMAVVLSLLSATCATAVADGVRDLAAAMSEQNKGNQQLGIVLYSAAIRDPALSDQNRMVAYYNRADAYQVEGDYDGAIGDYSELLRLNPRRAEHFKRRVRAATDRDICSLNQADAWI